ncbi:3-dehydroquinate synthase II, partial [Halolamina salina]
GSVNIAAFKDAGDHEAEIVDASRDTEPDIYVVGKEGEGDGTVDLPSDFSGSADLTTLRRSDDRAQGSYVRVFDEDYEEFAEEAARDAEYTIVATEDWDIIPLEN